MADITDNTTKQENLTMVQRFNHFNKMLVFIMMYDQSRFMGTMDLLFPL